jgi:class 3 adenylate cyclase/predicted ATPase
MLCSTCRKDNPADASFCEQCGSKLDLVCPACRAAVSPGARFCKKCGAATRSAKATAHVGDSTTDSRIKFSADAVAPDSLDGERKTVTALFADIKGSTELEQDLDPEEASAIVDPALRLMIDAVHRYDGYVVQSTGDGIFALFGAPVAHEDHPQRALYAALRMQDELRRYSAKLVADGGNPLQCRVGTNTGEVVVRSIATGGGHAEYTPIGHTTNLASRMQAVAPVGSIAVSQNTQKLVEGYFALKPLGPTKVKGVSEPVEVFEVTGLGPLRTRLQVSAQRGLTKFVGRERELDDLKRALELAKSGRGQIVAAVAEPGVGKSRLFHEFRPTSQSGCSVLAAYPVSYAKASPYLPVIELLNSYFEISPEDDARRRRQKIDDKLRGLDPSLRDTLPYLFALLGCMEPDDPVAQVDPQLRRRRTLDAAKRILVRESVRQPLILVLEDLHWIDGESEALLNLLADSIAMARILMLVNYRPEYRHDWGNKSNYTQLRLDPLAKESAEQVLAALLGEGKDLPPLKRLIIGKTEGNPFFIEEMVQALFEQGVLARNGTVKIVKAMNRIRLPATVQGVLASRMDRLPPNEKEMLQTLAVIGTEFPIALAAAVTGRSQEDLGEVLANLQLAEFIYERPALPDVAFTFKHALSRDVAYNSVLIEGRKLLHERVGAALEALYGDRLDDHLSALAHHYRQSANTRKAIHYLRLAGAQAAQRSANREAVAYFQSALDLLKSLPDSPERAREELDLLVKLGPVLMTLTGYAARESEQAYVRARELSARLGDNTRLFPVLWGLWLSHHMHGELKEARNLAGELMSIAEGVGDDTLRLEAHHASWATLWNLGELRASLLHVEGGAALYNPREHGSLPSLFGGHDPSVCGRNHAALDLWLLGYPDRGLESSRQALALAHELAHPNSLAWALIVAAMIDQLRGDRTRTAQRAEEAMAISTEQGFAQWLAMGTVLRGWAKGDPATREREAASGLAAWRATGAARIFVPYFLALTAEIHRQAGRVDEALEFVAEALDLTNRNGERWYESELHRLRGELSLMSDGSAESDSERHFRRAIEVARELEAKSPELRATTSLARLLANQGKRDEARAMLAEIYNWFTEGFDTADLKEANAMLDELSA